MSKAGDSSFFSEKPGAVKFRPLDRPVFHVLLVCLLGFIAYSNTFGAPFQFDDILLNIRWLGDLSRIPLLFLDVGDYFGSRPLLLATVSLNYYLGGVNPWGYHLVNLALHLANGALLYLLVIMSGRHLGYGDKAVQHAALFSAGLFVLHPVQTEAVTNIVNRSMLLAAFFYLSGMILFLKAVTMERRKTLYIGGLFVASLLGMASRENFATFPLMLILYDLFFISRFRFKELTGHWKAYFPVFLSLGYMAFIVLNNTYDRGADNPGIGVPHVDYFLTQLNVHWTYLRLLVLPMGQNIDYDYPISKTLFEFPTTLSFVGYLGLWAVGIALARKKPLISFSVLWFLVVLLPISVVVTFLDLRLDDVMFEHRLYLPGAAFYAMAGASVALALKKLEVGRLRTAVVAVGIIVPLVLSVASFKRNAIWQSGVSLWADAAMKSPRKARTHYTLGDAYSKIGQFDKAIEEFRTAIELKPNYSIAQHSYGLIFNQRAIKRNPNDAMAHYNIGTIYRKTGFREKAIEHYRATIRIKPDYAEAHNDLGSLLGDMGYIEEAIEQFQIAVKLNPGNAVAHNNLGMAYRMIGLTDKAEEHFRKARELD